MSLLRRLLLVFLLPFALTAPALATEVTLTPLPDRVRVEIGGTLFTEYIYADGASRPYCHPLLLPDGTSLVRDFPMQETPGEDRDHPHHRALMFAHGAANGIDFWNEDPAGGKTPKGRTVHDGGITINPATATIRTHNRWLDPTGALVATDETTLRFGGDATARWLDYAVTIHALPDRPLLLGDTKEGTMAIRLAQWLTLPHRTQGRDSTTTGHYLTAAGDRDHAVWGRRAAWCDAYATRGDRTCGVAIFDHPDNLSHPTWWMARDYGLFAANPFGQHYFEPEQKHPTGKGDHLIPAGGSLTLRYRFYFHEGDPVAAGIAARYADYAAGR